MKAFEKWASPYKIGWESAIEWVNSELDKCWDERDESWGNDEIQKFSELLEQEGNDV